MNTLEHEMTISFRIVEVTVDTFAAAKVLAQRYFLRGYDAVQLAAALEANRERTALGLAPSCLLLPTRNYLQQEQQKD